MNGNQIQSVTDHVPTVAATGGFEFVDGASETIEYTYDNNGNLTKDSNKGISNIAYNVLNLPSTVTFSDGSTIVYSYSADGTKLRTVHTISGTTTTKDYCNNVVYENGVQKMLLTEEGYVDLSNSTYYYYLKDHQGNNRVVINSSGAVQETNHYYPFGGVFASTSNVQPYKYNGKELDSKKGLNWYDYGARHYDAVLGRWHSVDPLAEKMYAWSPYAYCFNNPISLIDEEGKSPLKVLKAVWNVGKRAYKTYKKSGNLNLKQVFKDEALNIVDNVNTLLDGDASTFDKVIAGVDLLTGFGGEVSDGAKMMGIVDDAADIKKNAHNIFSGLGLEDGMKVNSSEILDMAEKFLGKGYKEIDGTGRFVSKDGTRVFRMGKNDIEGKHGGGSHVNFEILEPNSEKPGKMKVIKNLHIYINDKK